MLGVLGYFSWDQAKDMENSGLVSIHTHGKLHIPYGDESAEVIEEYITYAHSHLEEELGHSVNKVFAYPYGSNSSISREVLSNLGFIQNMLEDKYNTSADLNLHYLKRITIQHNYDLGTILKFIL